jgi:hypothetical protein
VTREAVVARARAVTRRVMILLPFEWIGVLRGTVL